MQYKVLNINKYLTFITNQTNQKKWLTWSGKL